MINPYQFKPDEIPKCVLHIIGGIVKTKLHNFSPCRIQRTNDFGKEILLTVHDTNSSFIIGRRRIEIDTGYQ